LQAPALVDLLAITADQRAGGRQAPRALAEFAPDYADAFLGASTAEEHL